MSGEVNIRCGEVLDISAVADLYQQLNHALEQEGVVNLQADSIERIDTAGLQVFVSFIQEMKRRDRVLHWQDPSEALMRSANYLGLKKILLLDEPDEL